MILAEQLGLELNLIHVWIVPSWERSRTTSCLWRCLIGSERPLLSAVTSLGTIDGWTKFLAGNEMTITDTWFSCDTTILTGTGCMGWTLWYNPFERLKVAKEEGGGKGKHARSIHISVWLMVEERESNSFPRKNYSLWNAILSLVDNGAKSSDRINWKENERIRSIMLLFERLWSKRAEISHRLAIVPSEVNNSLTNLVANQENYCWKINIFMPKSCFSSIQLLQRTKKLLPRNSFVGLL